MTHRLGQKGKVIPYRPNREYDYYRNVEELKNNDLIESEEVFE